MTRNQELKKLWKDINRTMWRAALEGVSPRNFIRAELTNRVARYQRLEKSASIIMARKHEPVSPIFRACCWLVQFPDEHDTHVPPADVSYNAFLNGVDISVPLTESRETSGDHYKMFVDAFVRVARIVKKMELDITDFEFTFSAERWRLSGTDSNPYASLYVNFFYLNAPDHIWTALLNAVKDRPSRKMAEQYAHSHDAQTLLSVYSDVSPLRRQDTYDLSQMFDELNVKYFNGALPKPLITWTQSPNYRTLGTYNYFWNAISITCVLNNPKIPILAVRYVLYHEMLHIKHGLSKKNNRAYAHTPAFRADEKQFEDYEKANEICRNLRSYEKIHPLT